MLTLKEIKQRLGWAKDGIEGFIEKGGGSPLSDPPTDTPLYHINIATEAIQNRISGQDGEVTTPPIPDNLSVNVAETREEAVTIQLSWPSVSGVDGYRVTAGVDAPIEDTVVEGTEYTFDHPRTTEDVTLWACVRGVVGDTEGDKRCNNTNVPAKSTQTTDPDSGTVEPWVEFDPDNYATDEELYSASVFGGTELMGDDPDWNDARGEIHLDTTQGVGGTSQSMRYDFINQEMGRGGPYALHVGRRIPLPEKLKGPDAELWAEFDVRWSDNWFDFPQWRLDDLESTREEEGNWTFAHKLFFIQTQAYSDPNNWTTSDGKKVGRWALECPSGGCMYGPWCHSHVEIPAIAEDSLQFESNIDIPNLIDGGDHKFRIHIRHDPGLYEIWVDGEQYLQVDGFTIHPEVSTVALLLGRNKDDGAYKTDPPEQLRWGKVKAWRENPGW